MHCTHLLSRLPRCQLGEERREVFGTPISLELLDEDFDRAEVDRTALVGYCLQYDRWRNAEAALADGGAVQQSKAEFGLTPSSRARLGAGGSRKNPEQDKFQAYLSRRDV